MSSANNDILLPPFQFGCLLFLFLVWLLWLGLPILFWIAVVEADILVLFLSLAGKLLVFAHWVWCWLYVSHIWPLLCWGVLPLFPLCWVFFFYHKWVLYFIKYFFCIYCYDHVIFVFCFVYVVYCIFWFVNIVPSLHPWDESHLIMVYDLFNILLVGVCQHLLRIVAYMFVSDIGLNFSFFVMSLSSFEIRMVLALKKEFRSLPSSWIFWNYLWRMGVSSPLNAL